MDPNLHQQMGIHHLNRVLSYSQFVVEDGTARVHLTPEDWHVVADTLFQMETPREVLPAEILDYKLTDNNRIIELQTSNCTIEIDMT
ncbi:MAG: hypothetical protein HKN13_14535 [Rhodothermales bacterium]|nr:hypothetical protein [Rhodothermales bacterium]